VKTHVNVPICLHLKSTLCSSLPSLRIVSEHEQICRPNLRMRYRMSVIYGHPVMAATRALRFSDHVTKRNGGSGDENGSEVAASTPWLIRFVSRFVRLDSEHAQSDRKSVNRGLPGPGFLVLTKRSVASGYDRECYCYGKKNRKILQCVYCRTQSLVIIGCKPETKTRMKTHRKWKHEETSR